VLVGFFSSFLITNSIQFSSTLLSLLFPFSFYIYNPTSHISFWSPPRGFQNTNIPPSTRSRTIRDEVIAAFHNPLNPQLGTDAPAEDSDDTSFYFDAVPYEEQQHLLLDSPRPQHHLTSISPLRAPIFTPSELPSPSYTPPSESRLTTPDNSIPQQNALKLNNTIPPPPVIMANIQNVNFQMPLRNERAAPTFDTSKPRELNRFFEDLEQLFSRVNYTSATNAIDMKKYTVRYVDFNTEQLWRTFPEFNNPANTYEDFKAAILVHYPDAAGDFIYSIRDMDLLIGEKQRIGINTNSEMADYHMKFLTITTWLIDKRLLSDLEQQRAYMHAFQPVLLNAVMTRLQLKKQDHYPNVPYKIEDVYEAARFVLQGSITTGYYAPISSTYTSAPTITDKPLALPVKTEDLSALLTEFAKIMKETLSANKGQGRSYNSSERRCFFCGKTHPDPCKEINRYIEEGKCRKNQEGRIVLSTGAYVPREITGDHLMGRIDEWHKRHPNQLASATLINMVDMRIVQANSKPAPTHSAYQLSTQERINALEAEMFALKTKKPIPQSSVRTRAQAARIEEVIEEEVEEVELDKARKDKEVEFRTNDSAPAKAPEHPFRNTRDAAYAPPTTRNVGAQDKSHDSRQPAYKTLPPIHDPEIANKVYKRSMEAQITITQRELLSLSPEVRSQVRESITTKRLPIKDTPVRAQHLYHEGDNEEDEENANIATLEAFAIPTTQHLPDDAIIIPDPFEVYLNSLKPDENPDMDRLVVARTSSSIRCIQAFVDNSQKHECILDPGSQVIAMSEEICHTVGLSYDPGLRIRLVSANATLDYTLGLARNVPFQLGKITVYLQVHIVRKPSYGILLGRPFDIVTQSVVRNFANADQTITIFDPNTGRRATIPTFARCKDDDEEKDF